MKTELFNISKVIRIYKSEEKKKLMTEKKLINEGMSFSIQNIHYFMTWIFYSYYVIYIHF